MLASPNIHTKRANVADPCKLNADSFRARCLAMGYIVADEKPKEQNPNRNLHWRPQPLHGQIPRAEEGHYSPELCGRRSNPQLNKNLRNSLNTKGLRGGPRKCLVINDLQMLASPNIHKNRANAAYPCKLNADSFRARCLAVKYALCR